MTGSALLFWLLLAAVVLGVAWAATGRRTRVRAGGQNAPRNTSESGGSTGGDTTQADRRLHEFADELTSMQHPQVPDPQFVRQRLKAGAGGAAKAQQGAGGYPDDLSLGPNLAESIRNAPADVEHTMAAYADAATANNKGVTRTVDAERTAGAYPDDLSLGNNLAKAIRTAPGQLANTMGEYADSVTSDSPGAASSVARAGASVAGAHTRGNQSGNAAGGTATRWDSGTVNLDTGRTEFASGGTEFADELTGSGDPAELADSQYRRDRLAGTARGAAYTFTQSSLAAERSRDVMSAVNDIDLTDAGGTTTDTGTRSRDAGSAATSAVGTGGGDTGGDLGGLLTGNGRRSRKSKGRATGPRGPGRTEPTASQMKQASKDTRDTTDPI